MWKIIANAFHLVVVIDCWRISNCKYTSRQGDWDGETGRRASGWLICDGISLSWWENRKLDVEMLEADGRTEWMLSMNINTVAISSLWVDTRVRTHGRIRFRHGNGRHVERVTSGKSQHELSLPHWTDLHTMHTLAHEYVVGGPFSFRFSNARNTLTRSPQGSGAKKQKPVSLAL